MGLIENANEWDYNNLLKGAQISAKKMGIKARVESNVDLAKLIIELGFKSQAKLFILPMQDLLFKNSDFRVNEPGSVKTKNWAIRFKKSDIKKSVAGRVKSLSEKYDRL